METGSIVDQAWLSLVMAFAAGTALGAAYFAALWWTVRALPGVRHPGRWLAASFLLRVIVLLAGFYAVMQGDWKRMFACLAGFLLARWAAVRHLQPASASSGRHQGRKP